MTRKEAIAIGLSKYSSGRRCKYGHEGIFYVSGRCVVCVKVEGRFGNKKKLARARIEKDKGSYLAKERARYRRQRERHLAWSKIHLQKPEVKARRLFLQR